MAKAFRFRLDTLLRLRQQHEDAEKRAVAARMLEVSRTQQRLADIAVAIARQTDALRRTTQGEMLAVDDLIAARNWLGRLRRDFLGAQLDLQEQQQRLIAARQQLAEAAKQTKVLSKLKERRRGEYEARQSRAEDILLDEVGVVNWARMSGADQGGAA